MKRAHSVGKVFVMGLLYFSATLEIANASVLSFLLLFLSGVLVLTRISVPILYEKVTLLITISSVV